MQCSATVSAACIEHVFTVTCSTLLVISVETRLFHVHLMLTMSVIINGLAMITIDTETHHVILHHGTVGIYVVVGICLFRESDRLNLLMFLIFCSSIAYAEVAISLILILSWFTFCRKNNSKCLLLLLFHIGEE